ncbi:MAG: protein kinase [Chloroflexota bacterium]
MEKGLVLGDRYKIDKRIGIGGMASVYKAEDMQLGRDVAIKIIHESLSGDEIFLKQFHNEAHAAANMSHPNIVMVHDIGQYDARYYMVMEYVEGQTLKDIILEYKDEAEFMPVERVLQLAIQICRGLGYAHRSGLVHCDMKPQNILVTSDDKAKITDFGISRAVSEATRSGSDMVWGTPQYFSPEQAAGEPPSPASDVYSIGIIMYEMLCNEIPFKGENPTAIALKHLQSPPQHIRSINKKVPPQVAQILHKVLAKEPAGRYRTAGQLQRILETYLKQSQETTSPFIESMKARTPANVDPDVTKIPVRQTHPQRVNQNRPANNRSNQASQQSRGNQRQSADRQSAKRKSNQQKNAQAIRRSAPSQDVFDNRLVILGIVAVFLLLGLIPLWYFVAAAWGVF